MGFDNFGLDYGTRFRQVCTGIRRKRCPHRARRRLHGYSQRLLNSPGVHLIELPIDYSENDRILNKELLKKPFNIEFNDVSIPNTYSGCHTSDGELIVEAAFDRSPIGSSADKAAVERALSVASQAFADRSNWLELPTRLGILKKLLS